MRQSIYLILATTLIKADIHNEIRKRRKQIRAERVKHLHLSDHLLRDIGLQPDGIVIGEKFSPSVKAERTVRHLRQLHYAKIRT